MNTQEEQTLELENESLFKEIEELLRAESLLSESFYLVPKERHYLPTKTPQKPSILPPIESSEAVSTSPSRTNTLPTKAPLNKPSITAIPNLPEDEIKSGLSELEQLSQEEKEIKRLEYDIRKAELLKAKLIADQELLKQEQMLVDLNQLKSEQVKQAYLKTLVEKPLAIDTAAGISATDVFTQIEETSAENPAHVRSPLPTVQPYVLSETVEEYEVTAEPTEPTRDILPTRLPYSVDTQVEEVLEQEPELDSPHLDHEEFSSLPSQEEEFGEDVAAEISGTIEDLPREMLPLSQPALMEELPDLTEEVVIEREMLPVDNLQVEDANPVIPSVLIPKVNSPFLRKDKFAGGINVIAQKVLV
ncbi:hypothetical protein [Endozoicomonas atrinae]|uniref:hypothetical protein n=1 Tax=Endozoicomonas atrinae TaxID=1333660 RepID=UPI003B008A5A